LFFSLSFAAAAVPQRAMANTKAKISIKSFLLILILLFPHYLIFGLFFEMILDTRTVVRGGQYNLLIIIFSFIILCDSLYIKVPKTPYKSVKLVTNSL
jgi:hypothetical protein